ncbi:MAG: RNA 2',3'-cyclic phosphodiesterase [Candidatus Riflebacteria bacterium]|nr:RNA 2',3'-cyclic phosphodiesterase [Candidatus Riflebacteria bacterium]
MIEDTGTIRAFFAICLPDSIKNEIQQIQKNVHNSWRITGKSQLHLTLAFMGALPSSKLSEIFSIAKDVSKNFSKFELELTESSIFPSLKVPRVLVLGVKSDILIDFANSLLKKLNVFADQKKFSGHITIARARDSKPEIQHLEAKGKWLVEDFKLFKSELQPTGPVYTILEKFDLIQS